MRFVFNAYWEPLEFALPVPDTSTDGWRRLVDTSLESPHDIAFEWDEAPEVAGPTHRVEARSVVVLAARRAAGTPPAGGRTDGRRTQADGERRPSGERLARGQPVVRVGAVSRRAGLGRRPRGLLRRRRRVELVPARPRPLAGVPLERGRDGGDDRRLQPPVARAVAVERPGPDPQGADVRAGRPRGQPRRGRQGILVVPRRRPEQRLAALALPLPAGRVPVRGPGRDQPRAVQARTRIRADRHRHLRRRPLLDRRGPLRQGERDRHPDADHRAQPGPGGRHAPRPADAVVPQRVVVEPRAGQARAARGPRRPVDPGEPPRARRLRARHRPRSGRDAADPALLRERDEPGRDRGRSVDHAVPEGRDQRPRHRRCSDGQPGRRRHEGLAVVPAGRAARRDGRAPAAPAQAAQGGQASRRERGGARRCRSRDRRAAARAATARPRRRTSTPIDPLGPSFESTMQRRESEADDFYEALRREGGTDDEQRILRQAFAGMLWSKQYYGYNVARWLDGDPGLPPPPPERKTGRNADWRHFDAADILSMPDPWEYPWFAAWDLAFHAVTFAHIDPAFAKYQLLLLCREWFQHPRRGAAGLRMVVRRRQPAGPRRGRVPRVRDRRAQGLRVPAADLPQAAHQLHLVAQPPGQGGQRPLLGRLPGPRQHRRVRPVPPAGRHRARAVRRDGLDVPVLPEHAADRDGAVRRRPDLRGLPDDVHGARRPDRRGDEPERLVGPGRRLLLRRAQARRRHGRADQGPLDGRPHPAPAGRVDPGEDGPPRSVARQAVRQLHGVPCSSRAKRSGRAATSPVAPVTRTSSSASSRRSGSGSCWARCCPRTGSCRRTGCARCRSVIASSRSSSSSAA